MAIRQHVGALFTDLYEVTMAQAYWAERMSGTAVFEIFFRKLPPGRSYIMAAGLADVVEFLEAFRFDEQDLRYLRGLGQFSDEFLRWLAGVRFTGDVWAAPEGTVIFPNEPAVQLIAPIIEAGHLTVPEKPRGIVVFAHGSGSSRHSIRNRYVAEVLTGAGFATLLFDLLTPEEERNRANVFDIELLASRLIDVTGWLATQPDTASLPVGYFGASTGAGAALVAAADPRVNVRAVVSRGGRPDLAGDSLGSVVAPTLLIVGGRDQVVLELNQRAQAVIPGKCQLTVVPGATHLFEEPGTLEQVAKLACDWFIDHLCGPGPSG